MIVAIGDRPFDPDGYWPADVAMLTTIAGLETIDIVSTSNVLDAGYLDRLRLAFVEIEIETAAASPAEAGRCLRDPPSGRSRSGDAPSSRIAIARTSSKASRGASRPIAAAA